jgi:hypothetical protein
MIASVNARGAKPMKEKQKMPFKDWCRNCESHNKSSSWCFACQYKLLREMIVDTPLHFKNKKVET